MRILLNTLKRDNYAFFDAESRACLDISSPGALVDDVVTPALRRGILCGTIIDVDNFSKIELKPNQLRIQQLLLKHMGIVPIGQEQVKAVAPVAPVEPGESAIDKLNAAQEADEAKADEAKVEDVQEPVKTSKANKAKATKKEGEE